jgi:hypothetical protein
MQPVWPAENTWRIYREPKTSKEERGLAHGRWLEFCVARAQVGEEVW